MINLPENAVHLVSGCVALVKSYLTAVDASQRLEMIVKETQPHWQGQFAFSGGKKYFDKGHTMSRFGDSGVTYTYKGKAKPMHPMTMSLSLLRDMVQVSLNWRSNCVVVNTYMPTSHLYPHRDSNYISQLGSKPTIVGLSFGTTRTFELTPWNFETNRRDKSREKICVELEHGDLLVMYGDCDLTYKHGIPEEPETVGQRVSLTFRKHT